MKNDMFLTGAMSFLFRKVADLKAEYARIADAYFAREITRETLGALPERYTPEERAEAAFARREQTERALFEWLFGQYTVFNAAFHTKQFWDGRAANLQEQAGGPPLNPVEMGYEHPDDWNKIAAKLNADTAFAAEFKKVYPQGFTGETITNAIAEYEKTLITPNSPFDRYLKGDENAISENAKMKSSL